MQDRPFFSEVEVKNIGWLLYFSDLQIEHQYLTLGFIIHAKLLSLPMMYVVSAVSS